MSEGIDDIGEEEAKLIPSFGLLGEICTHIIAIDNGKSVQLMADSPKYSHV